MNGTGHLAGEHMRKTWRIFIVILYFTIAKHLPVSYDYRGGRISRRLRAWIGRQLLDECGKNVNIEHGASFGTGRGIRLGDDSDLGVDCQIHGRVTIGKNSFMGPEVAIWTTNHRFDRTDIPMMFQGNQVQKPVFIGNDVWIGTRAILLPGVHVGDHSIIGAGAVVAKDVPPWAIVVGNPARVVRYRNSVSNFESESPIATKQ